MRTFRKKWRSIRDSKQFDYVVGFAFPVYVIGGAIFFACRPSFFVLNLYAVIGYVIFRWTMKQIGL